MCSFITVQSPLTSIPLFPLGLLPLPGERLALHIFEPRYQRLFHALEHNEVEEIGIAYHTPSNPHSFDAPIYGGIVRLVFATEPGRTGERDAVVQCVNLFTTTEIHSSNPNNEPPYPMGHVERVQAWKNWGVPNGAIPHIETLAEYWKSQGSKAEVEGPVKTLTEAMVRYDFNPIERHEVLRCKSEEKRHARFIETVQFKALIVQQMQLNSKGQFPN